MDLLAGPHEDTTRELARLRKENEVLRQMNMVKSLGLPVRTAQDVPATFSVPIVKHKVVPEKPHTPKSPYQPEPVMTADIYQSILEICYDFGVEMERHPSVYLDKGEETLRDHFIMQLSPHFQSVTGETFNKHGRTDILVRHEGKNLFVAECKVWQGQKKHQQTLDQILRYLTWRDSKAAVIYFIRNQQLEPVLETIRVATPDHSCFVSTTGEVTRGRYSFRFHLSEDTTRGVDLAVLCFHFPE